MSDVAVTLVYGDQGDWIGVYGPGGGLLYEGHSIEPEQLLDIVECSYRSIHNQPLPSGHLPQRLEDLPKEEPKVSEIQVILANEKHADRVIRADDGTLESAALKLLDERVSDDYWYDEEDEVKARKILDRGDGPAAWSFLQARRDHEYEFVEHQTI